MELGWSIDALGKQMELNWSTLLFKVGSPKMALFLKALPKKNPSKSLYLNLKLLDTKIWRLLGTSGILQLCINLNKELRVLR